MTWHRVEFVQGGPAPSRGGEDEGMRVVGTSGDGHHVRDGRTFEQLLGARAFRMAFQPIVTIAGREVVGYEALVRGPVGSALATPGALLAEAARTRRTDEFNWVCRAMALREFLSTSLPNSLALFVNVEPATLGSKCPPDLVPIFDAAASANVSVVLELTERSVDRDPAGLLRAVRAARGQSRRIALDDVGTSAASLAMMPLVHPDVIKLDLSLIQQQTTPTVARIVNAVLAEAERTGAAVVAEGIESESHSLVARSLGAVLGQGWLYGRPGPLPARVPPPHEPIRRYPTPEFEAATPFEVVAGRNLARAPEQLLMPMSVHLEYRVLNSAEPTVLLACVPNSNRFNVATQHRYAHLATRAAFTAVLGRDLPAEPGPGIRGASLTADDPIGDEWSTVVLGPHFAGALLAKQCPRDDQSGQRQFDFVITHDRDLVIAAAVPIVSRVLAQDGPSISKS